MFKRLLQALGLLSDDSFRSFQLEAELRASLQDLANQEQRPVSEVAQDLLHQALETRQADRQAWRAWRELTPRQQEVAALICLGYTTPQIAARLSVSPETVKTHVHNLLEKFSLRTRHELRQALVGWDFSAWK